MATIDSNQLSTLLTAGPVLVDFSAAWCGPCKVMKPVVTSLADDYAGKVNVAVVDIDEQPVLATEYGVTSVPTFVLFKDGREVDRLVGAVPRPVLEQRLDRLVA